MWHICLDALDHNKKLLWRSVTGCSDQNIRTTLPSGFVIIRGTVDTIQGLSLEGLQLKPGVSFVLYSIDIYTLGLSES